MDRQRILRAFADIGARARIQPLGWPAIAEAVRSVDVRVASDADGEFFDVRVHPHLPITHVEARVDAGDAGEPVLVLTVDSLGGVYRVACSRAGGSLRVAPPDEAELVAMGR